ncbi:MAG: hypothetical protein Ct9H300mP1_01660 [Planctomycetaceae bacterium]|nr:MAG: hypothetical protein Ct9H300mP1_01660 [Planctomycetaceae bacterium]
MAVVLILRTDRAIELNGNTGMTLRHANILPRQCIPPIFLKKTVFCVTNGQMALDQVDADRDQRGRSDLLSGVSGVERVTVGNLCESGPPVETASQKSGNEREQDVCDCFGKKSAKNRGIVGGKVGSVLV